MNAMNELKQQRVSSDNVAEIIAKDNPEKLVEVAQRVIQGREQFTTSQIRNIFGPVRRIALEWPQSLESDKDQEAAEKAYRQVVLLRPKLRYLAARDNKLRELADILDAGIREIQEGSDLAEKKERFGRFVDFFEAILAYHTEKARESGRNE